MKTNKKSDIYQFSSPKEICQIFSVSPKTLKTWERESVNYARWLDKAAGLTHQYDVALSINTQALLGPTELLDALGLDFDFIKRIGIARTTLINWMSKSEYKLRAVAILIGAAFEVFEQEICNQYKTNAMEAFGRLLDKDVKAWDIFYLTLKRPLLITRVVKNNSPTS